MTPTPDSAVPLPSDSVLSPVERDAVLRQTMSITLRTVTLTISLLGFVFVLVQPWVVTDPTGGGLRWLALVGAIVIAGLGVGLRQWPSLTHYAHEIGTTLVAVVWLNTFLHLALTGDLRHTINIALVVVGMGFFLLSTPWFVASLLVIFGSWLGVVALAGPTPDWAYYAFHLFSAMVLGGLGHFTRRKRIFQQAALHLQLQRRQRDLEQSEERFRALSAATSEGVLVHDQGIVLDANEAAAEMLGYEQAELIGKNAFLFITPESQPVAQTHVRLDYSQPYEIMGLRRDGSTFPAELVGRPGLWRGRMVRVVVVRDLTERKRAEAALREAEQKYRTLLEHNPAVVYTDALNDRSSTIYISPQVEALTGYTSAEWMADPELWEKLIHPDDYPSVMAEHMRTNATHDAFHMEYRLVARDERVVWVRDEAVLIWMGEDQPAFWHGYLLDITALKQVEAAQLESEQRYRTLFISAQRQAQDLALLDKVRTVLARELDLSSVLRTVVESIAETFGYTLVSIYLVQGDELRLQHQIGYHQVIDPIPRGQGVLWRTIESGEAMLIRDVQADSMFLGAISDIVSEIGVPLTDQGRPVGGLNIESIHGVPLDEADLQLMISVGRQASIAIERANLHAQVRDNELALRALYNITASPTRLFADQVQALLALGCQRFGLETGILSRIEGDLYHLVRVSSPDERFVAGQVLELRVTYCQETLIRAEPLGIEHATESDFAQHPCHLVFAIEAYLGVSVRVGARLYGTLAFFNRAPHERPFTSTEFELLRLMAQWLGGEIEREQRTEQLQAYAAEIAHKNEALAQARDQALETSNFKSEFLANISHEIRTPLNALIGMNELMAETALTPDQHEYLALMRDSSNMLLTVVNDILDFSKIETGQLGLESSDFNLRETLEQVTATLTPRARQKGLALITQVAPELPAMVRGDPERVRQVVLNLLGNAVKFTEAGKVLVRATLEAQDATHLTLRVTVTDTGPGLTEEVRSRLFQPFMRVTGPVTQHFGGTGLGLSISKRLVELMGGAIGVESGGPTGRGSTFWFTARLERASAAFPPSPSLPDESLPAPKLRSGHLLLVEDNTVNRQVIQRQLQRLGYTVQAVHNGREAVEAVARARAVYSAVLMDVQMPEMDGLTATRLIRQAEAGTAAHLPIIAITAHAHASDQADCLAAGMDAYLSKPINIAQLRETLARWAAAEAPPPAVSPLNAPALKNLRELQRLGAPNFLHDFIDLYLRDTDGLLTTLRQALDNGRTDTVAHTAQQLKRTSQSLGADALTGLCEELEASASSSALEDIRLRMARVEDEYTRVRLALQHEEGPPE